MNKRDRVERFEKLMGITVPLGAQRELEYKGFFTAPASTKYHGNYEGGLFDHSYEVANTLLYLTKTHHLIWRDPRSPLIVGMFHDLCKMDNYILVDGHYEYATDTLLKGHGDKSVMMLSEYFKLTEEEIMCIRYHMGGFL